MTPARDVILSLSKDSVGFMWKSTEMRITHYFVYIVLCADKSYYTGFTNNLDRRIEEHNLGLNENCYTYRKRPVKLVYYEVFTDPLEGIAVEKQIKGWSRKKKEALINKKEHLLPSLSRSRS
jgi:putative endonuclease